MQTSRMNGVKLNEGNLPAFQQVNRHAVALENPVDGLYPYNNRLFDCDVDDSLIALSLLNAPHPFLEAFPISNSTTWKHTEAMLSYMGGEGTAAGTAGNGAVADACEGGECIEAGYVMCEVEGFGRMRRCGFARNIGETNLRYTEVEPVYDIAGNRIENDFEYDSVRIANAQLLDLHNGFFTFDAVNAGEFDGILAWMTFGNEDGFGNPAPFLDAMVVDWGGNAVADYENGLANDIVVNGTTIAAGDLEGFTLIDYIRDYVQRVGQRVRTSSLNGNYDFIAAADGQLIQCLIDAYVCYTVCGRDIIRMDSAEARQEQERLRSSVQATGAIGLRFDGFNIWFYSWDFAGLYDNVEDTYSLFITVPRIGNRNVWDFEFLDLGSSIASARSEVPFAHQVVTMDNGRFAKWSEQTGLCIKPYVEFRPRLRTCTKWVSTLITNISCEGSVFGRFSTNPLDEAFLGMGGNLGTAPLIAAPEYPANTG